jgi:hypothetical protein
LFLWPHGLNLDEVKIYGKFGQQLPIIVHSWSQCLAGNCGNYGPQHTVDGQIWNAAYLSSGTNQMVLAGGGPSFVTYKVQSAVAKMVIYDRKLNTPAWYTNLGSYVFFHNSSTTGLASSLAMSRKIFHGKLYAKHLPRIGTCRALDAHFRGAIWRPLATG